MTVLFSTLLVDLNLRPVHLTAKRLTIVMRFGPVRYVWCICCKSSMRYQSLRGATAR